MKERLKAHVGGLFNGAANDRRIIDIQEELLSDISEKYDDLISQGVGEEEAFTSVVTGIGDIEGLLADIADADRRSFAEAALKGKRFRPFQGGKKYVKKDDTFAEQYKEKISGSDKFSRMMRAAVSSLWLLITIIYFGISFATHQWGITWIIFPAGAVLTQLIHTFINKRVNINGMIWSSAVVIYLVISFTTNSWNVSWLVFLAAAAFGQILRFLAIWREQ